nr:reverse transcriptase domain-containing protein [Tanacetum cinerariifolium]
MSADSTVTYSFVHSEVRSWSIPSEDPYEEAAQQLFEQAPHSPEYVPMDHVPVFVPEFEHPEDLVPAEDEAPTSLPLLATPRPGCEVGESFAAAARRPGPTMAYGVDCSYLETRLRDAERRMMAALELVNMRVSYQVDVYTRESSEFCTRHHDAQKDRTAVGAEIEKRVNPKIHDVIKQEVIKLLEAGLIYPISDSPWVSPVHCVPNKGGFPVVENEDNELIPTRLVTGWRVCIDYRKLNEATRKDHFPLPFMDQMLERLAGNQYYCFLDGFSSYF